MYFRGERRERSGDVLPHRVPSLDEILFILNDNVYPIKQTFRTTLLIFEYKVQRSKERSCLILIFTLIINKHFQIFVESNNPTENSSNV